MLQSAMETAMHFGTDYAGFARHAAVNGLKAGVDMPKVCEDVFNVVAPKLKHQPGLLQAVVIRLIEQAIQQAGSASIIKDNDLEEIKSIVSRIMLSKLLNAKFIDDGTVALSTTLIHLDSRPSKGLNQTILLAVSTALTESININEQIQELIRGLGALSDAYKINVFAKAMVFPNTRHENEELISQLDSTITLSRGKQVFKNALLLYHSKILAGKIKRLSLDMQQLIRGRVVDELMQKCHELIGFGVPYSMTLDPFKSYLAPEILERFKVDPNEEYLGFLTYSMTDKAESLVTYLYGKLYKEVFDSDLKQQIVAYIASIILPLLSALIFGNADLEAVEKENPQLILEIKELRTAARSAIEKFSQDMAATQLAEA